MSKPQLSSSWSIIESIGPVVYVVDQTALADLKKFDSTESFLCSGYEVLGSGRFIKFVRTYTLDDKLKQLNYELSELVLDTDRYTLEIRGYDSSEIITKLEKGEDV